MSASGLATGRRLLVLGASGMLAPVCRALVARGDRVVAVARRTGPLELHEEKVARDAAEGRAPDLDSTDPGLPPLQLVAADWTDPEGFLQAVAPRLRGIDGVLAWVHAGGAEAARRVGEALGRRQAAAEAPLDWLDVFGSGAASPDASVPARVEGLPGLRPRRVVLGWAHEAGTSRWLGGDEIAAGVLAAWDSGEPARVVGEVRPWSRRP